MPIYKKHRTLSEKTTSIEDPIEVVQRGVIEFAPAANAVSFLIPTQITNPVKLSITPMNAQATYVLGASNAAGKKNGMWYSDLTLHYATNAGSLAFGSCASTASYVGRRLKMYDAKLYVNIATLAAGSCSTTGFVTALASGGRWRQLEEFGSNSQKYLVVTPGNGVVTAMVAGAKTRIAYEVVGYEY